MSNGPTNEMMGVHPACDLCGGMCCKVVKAPKVNPQVDEVLKLRSLHWNSASFLMACECNKLTCGGRCAVYHSRPEHCNTGFPLGGTLCREIVQRMHPNDWQEIFDAMKESNDEQEQA